MNLIMQRTGEEQYLDLLRDVLDHGQYRDDRTKTGTQSVFGRQIRFDLSEGFPLLTTKKVFLKAILHELLWFLQGSSNIKYLVDNGVHIWDDWPYRYYQQSSKSRLPDGQVKVQSLKLKESERNLTQVEFVQRIKEDDKFAKKWGELGPVYGVQWRHWKTPDGQEIDQIARVIEQIKDVKKNKNSSYSRRLVVSAWNVADIEEMAKSGLPPCHSLFQFYVLNNKLSCQLYQRSADMFLGVPFNIASYSLLTMMVAQVCDLELGDFVHTFGDTHIYSNHIDQVQEQLTREPRKLPVMKINPEVSDIFSFTYEDFTLEEYNPYPPIKASVAV